MLFDLTVTATDCQKTCGNCKPLAVDGLQFDLSFPLCVARITVRLKQQIKKGHLQKLEQIMEFSTGASFESGAELTVGAGDLPFTH